MVASIVHLVDHDVRRDQDMWDRIESEGMLEAAEDEMDVVDNGREDVKEIVEVVKAGREHVEDEGKAVEIQKEDVEDARKAEKDGKEAGEYVMEDAKGGREAVKNGKVVVLNKSEMDKEVVEHEK